MNQDLSFSEMQSMQKTLMDRYKAVWAPLSPEEGKNQLLWLYGEMAEVGDIMKKCGVETIMEDSETRNHFIEEMADCMMYFTDIMLCYDVSPSDLREAFIAKFRRNLDRWSTEE